MLKERVSNSILHSISSSFFLCAPLWFIFRRCCERSYFVADWLWRNSFHFARAAVRLIQISSDALNCSKTGQVGAMFDLMVAPNFGKWLDGAAH